MRIQSRCISASVPCPGQGYHRRTLSLFPLSALVSERRVESSLVCQRECGTSVLSTNLSSPSQSWGPWPAGAGQTSCQSSGGRWWCTCACPGTCPVLPHLTPPSPAPAATTSWRTTRNSCDLCWSRRSPPSSASSSLQTLCARTCDCSLDIFVSVADTLINRRVFQCWSLMLPECYGLKNWSIGSYTNTSSNQNSMLRTINIAWRRSKWSINHDLRKKSFNLCMFIFDVIPSLVVLSWLALTRWIFFCFSCSCCTPRYLWNVCRVCWSSVPHLEYEQWSGWDLQELNL